MLFTFNLPTIPSAGNTQSVCSDLENLVVLLMVSANRNFSVEVRVSPVRITAETIAASNMDAMFIAAVFFGLPEVRNALKLGNFTLNQIAIKFGLGLSAASSAARVIEPTLKQKPVEGFIHKQLPCRLAIVERFRIIRIRSSEDYKSNVVASVAGTSAVVVAIEDVKGVAGNHRRTAIISFRITHRQEVRGINRHEKLEVNFLARKLVGKPGEEMLELTARAQIRDAERIANRLENPATLFARSVGMRRELIDSVNVVVDLVVGAREEADRAFNQGELIAIGVQLCGAQNVMGEVVNERVVGIVGLGAVDDDCLQVLVPALRLAEEFAQGAFADDRIGSEAFDEFFGDVLENVVGIGVAKIIVQSRPNVVASEFLEFVHGKDLRK